MFARRINLLLRQHFRGKTMTVYIHWRKQFFTIEKNLSKIDLHFYADFFFEFSENWFILTDSLRQLKILVSKSQKMLYFLWIQIKLFHSYRSTTSRRVWLHFLVTFRQTWRRRPSTTSPWRRTRSCSTASCSPTTETRNKEQNSWFTSKDQLLLCRKRLLSILYVLQLFYLIQPSNASIRHSPT